MATNRIVRIRRPVGPDQHKGNNAKGGHGEELADVNCAVRADPGNPGVESKQACNRLA
jgi:hypothetical protein